MSYSIKQDIIEEALKLSGFKEENKIIETALLEYIIRHKRKSILELENNVQWENNLDELRRNRL